MDMPFRFYPCFAAGLAYYIAIKKAPDRAILLKEMYEEIRQNSESSDTPKVQISLEDAMKDLGID